MDQLTRRGTAAGYSEPVRSAPNAALLIDFDNVTMGIRSDLQQQLRTLLDSELFKGKISVQRAYADWRRYPQYIVPLSEASIDLIFAPAFGSNKKNATDIRLAIDALELVFTRPEIGTFVLLSGDSDFSSLVLKLKEYGKYVIGVGIRESSSDLLVQNCDEYYGYSELTGLLREGDVEHRRRDPWELVVEATTQMKQSGDVMRSDRLKQVMQSIDPNFDEKDAGFSKYSKFLVEAVRRGLLRIAKLENGQHEVDVGPNANVPPEVETSLAPAKEPAGETRGRRRRGERDKERPRSRARAAATGLPLALAFDLLREALTALGAVGEEATDADQAREQMIELAENGDDPVFDGSRFQRMLRQAHDAGVIDLAKKDDVYLLKLRPAQPAHDEPEGPPSRTRRAPRGRKRAEPKKRTAKATDADAPAPEPEATPPAASPKAKAAKSSKRNPRYRRGSRGAPTATAEGKAGDEAPTEPERPPAETKEPAEPARRSVRGRGGSRSRRPPTKTSAARAATAEDAPAPEPPPRERARAARERDEPPPPPEEDAASESGGLLKRMSAALQRAMLGPEKREDTED